MIVSVGATPRIISPNPPLELLTVLELLLVELVRLDDDELLTVSELDESVELEAETADCELLLLETVCEDSEELVLREVLVELVRLLLLLVRLDCVLTDVQLLVCELNDCDKDELEEVDTVSELELLLGEDSELALLADDALSD